ncbi:MAG: hypothetical protein ACI9E5_001292 [Candidatus Omnitrophota bacterium]|jgi:hypothetical protein
MNRIMKVMLMLSLCFGFSTVMAQASEIEILVNKLVDKGILSPIEADIIKDETKQAVVAEVSEGKSYAIPAWVQNVKIKQDLRLRHQWEKKKSDAEGRNRSRIRYRLGLETKVADGITAGIGLATGGTDHRSTNETLEDTFESPDIRLDYAYGEWKVNNQLKVVGGKHKRKAYLWTPTDLLWDSDVNPNGVAFNFKQGLSDTVSGWVNGSYWIVDHRDQDDPDPSMVTAQVGLTHKGDKTDAKLAGTYYDFHGLEGRANQTNGSGTNTTDANGIKYDFDILSASAELGVKELFGGLPLSIDQRVAIFGEYVHNTEADSQNDGWAIGVKLGSKKVKKPGTWQLKYIHANLETDAFVDFLPDSDRYGGNTNVQSDEVALKYAIKKNVVFGLDYYNSDRNTGISDKEQVVQADLQLKF